MIKDPESSTSDCGDTFVVSISDASEYGEIKINQTQNKICMHVCTDVQNMYQLIHSYSDLNVHEEIIIVLMLGYHAESIL